MRQTRYPNNLGTLAAQRRVESMREEVEIAKGRVERMELQRLAHDLRELADRLEHYTKSALVVAVQDRLRTMATVADNRLRTLLRGQK